MGDRRAVRDLTAQERDLVRWLLGHGDERASSFLPHVDALLVVASCACGCPSIDFVEREEGTVDVLSESTWRDEEGRHFYMFVFAQGERLAGLEVGSLDGKKTPSVLPETEWLEPLRA